MHALPATERQPRVLEKRGGKKKKLKKLDCEGGKSPSIFLRREEKSSTEPGRFFEERKKPVRHFRGERRGGFPIWRKIGWTFVRRTLRASKGGGRPFGGPKGGRKNLGRKGP